MSLNKKKDALGIIAITLLVAIIVQKTKILGIAALAAMAGYIILTIAEFIAGFVDYFREEKLTPAQKDFYERRKMYEERK